MNGFPLAFPLVAVAVLAATAMSLPASADDCGRPAATVAAPVVDDPEQPLDPRDPQFAEKAAQRYERMLRTAPAGRAEATR